ncbi:TRAP transporter substrate-binding protein [Aneurinibacillus tyrosinisolvens]|uniref:TRAP transporter substrate-binding protein n=1 Tax=Aneurinibacillus tyrosinisolvens TaxID=1443435 RepID=UPI00063F09AC|nr:TRAP transporter substrate-binding protein [Aneurinibacillus tyrosinisolvens]
MKKWVKNLAISFVVPSMLLLGGCGGGSGEKSTAASPTQAAPSGSKERTLKMGISIGKDHPLGQGIDKFADIVKQKSDGKIKVQNYYDSTLGDEKKMAEAVKAGLQDMTVITTAPLTGTVKEFGVFDFPFTFNNEKEVDTVLQGAFGKKMLETLPPHNLVGLSFWENGFRNVTSAKHPITSVDDFKGMKIRTMQNPIHLEVFKTFGANPTPMAISEVFTALESKAIDGQENPVQIIENLKMNEVQKYLSLTKHVYAPFIFLVNKKLWNELSDDEKKIMQEAADEAGKFQRETIRASTKETIEKLKADGMQVNELSPEATAKMQELAKPLMGQFSKQIGEDLVKEFFDEVSKARQ